MIFSVRMVPSALNPKFRKQTEEFTTAIENDEKWHILQVQLKQGTYVLDLYLTNKSD